MTKPEIPGLRFMACIVKLDTIFLAPALALAQTGTSKSRSKSKKTGMRV